MEKMKKLLEKFKDELFAEKFECVNCSDEVLKENKYHLCDDCLDNIDFIHIACRKCGDKVNEYTFYCATTARKQNTTTTECFAAASLTVWQSI